LQQRRAEDRVLRPGCNVAQPFPVVRSEGRDEDQADHVVSLGGDVRDDCARVRMSDEEHRPFYLVNHAGDVCGVIGEPTERVGRRDDGVALALQPLDDSVPARRIGEGTMHEDIVSIVTLQVVLIRVTVRAIVSPALLVSG
jgi:hypothetical protein